MANSNKLLRELALRGVIKSQATREEVPDSSGKAWEVDEGEKIGKYAEDRFMSIMQSQRQDWPSWMIEVTKATAEQDTVQMTDAWVHTQHKSVPIQIKHSYAQKAHYKKRNKRHDSEYRRKRIEELVFIVVHAGRSDAEVFSDVLTFVKEKLVS
jgi:hypothetical protein